MAIYNVTGSARQADTEAELTAANPFLGLGELVFAVDTGAVKVGPGHWNSLAALSTLVTGTYAATTTDVLTSKVTGDTYPRFTINADGKIEWGSGSGALDTSLYRSAANSLTFSGDFYTGGLTVTYVTALRAGQANVVPLTVDGAAAQAADLQQWRNSAGTVFTRVSAAGELAVSGAVINGVTTALYARGPNEVGAVVRGDTAQAADLQQWQSGAAAALLSVTAAGLPRWVAAANQQTTVGAAGGAAALPATPTKYLKVVDSAGTTLVIPAYAAA